MGVVAAVGHILSLLEQKPGKWKRPVGPSRTESATEPTNRKPCTTTSTAAAAAFAGKEFQFKQCTNQSMKDSTGEQECSLKICSTKRKVPADGHDEEDIALAEIGRAHV